MALPDIGEAVKAESQAYMKLQATTIIAQAALTTELNEHLATILFHGLEEAVKAYELSVTAILIAAGNNQKQKDLFVTKLDDQMIKVNPVLDDLWNTIKKLQKVAFFEDVYHIPEGLLDPILTSPVTEESVQADLTHLNKVQDQVNE